MKAVSCKTCGNMRSSRIKTCPTCEDSTLGLRRIAARLTAIALVGVAAVWSHIAADMPLLGIGTADATTSANFWGTGASGSAEVACEEDLSCWGNRHLDEAILACKTEMTRQRGDSLHWVPGYASESFDGYAWHPTAPLAIAYSGNGARVVESDGGLRLISYTCDFDPVAREVISLRLD